MSLAFLFPGQGTQYVGMGKILIQDFPEARAVFEEAQRVVGFPLLNLIENGPEEELRKTENSQPAILATSIAYASVLELKGVKPSFLAGHSLGEYSALVFAGALSLSDAVHLVRLRGQFMQEAVPVGDGDMIAVMGLEMGDIKQICKEASSYGVVEPACFNYPKQVVLSGHKNAVAVAGRLARERKAIGVTPLSVSCPFHCSLLKSAAVKLSKVLEEIEIGKPKIPYIANATGEIVEDESNIKSLLVEQVTKPVLWSACIDTLINKGVDKFIEMGPGRVLSGHVRRINRSVSCIPVDDEKNLKALLK